MTENQCPENGKEIKINMVGFTNPVITDQLSPIFCELVVKLSNITDLNFLDGITFAIDTEEYIKSMKSFDNRINPSNDEGVGIAKTISNIEGDWSKNHVIINCQYLELENLLEEYRAHTSEDKQREVLLNLAHIIFHEFCHVTNNKFLFNNFDELLIDKTFCDDLAAIKYTITTAVWDEYNVCSLANRVGSDQEERYRSILLDVMNNFKSERDSIYRKYLSGNGDDRFFKLFIETVVVKKN